MMKTKPLADHLHIFLLCGVAFAQPLFDVLSSDPEFFAARGSRLMDIILLALTVCVVVPMLMALLEMAVARISTKFGRWVHRLWVVFLLGMIGLTVLKSSSKLSGLAVLFIATGIAAGVTVLYGRVRAFRSSLTFLAPFIVIIPGLFLTDDAVLRNVSSEQESFTLADVKSQTPVVFFIFDQLPLTFLMDEEGRIDDVRYPNVARLARRSIWYRNTTIVSHSTASSVSAILSGVYPGARNSPTLRDYPNNLFTLLGGSHELYARESATGLCPRSLQPSEADPGLVGRFVALLKDASAVYLQIVLPEEYAELFPPVKDTWGNFWDQANVRNGTNADRADQFEEFLNGMQQRPVPALYFAHVMLPHGPLQYLPSGSRFRDLGFGGWGYTRDRGGRWQDQDWITRQAKHMYLLQVGFLDRLIGKMIDRMTETGLWDDSLLIVTSDHGLSFWPGESNRIPERENAQDILFVPLFVKLPGQEKGVIDDRSLQTVDILPTLVDALKIQAPWSMDGVSALGSLQPYHTERQLIYGKSDLNLKDRSFKRQISDFGSRKALPEVVCFDHCDLIGKRIDVLNIADAGGPDIELMKPELFRNVDPNTTFVPVNIGGYVRSSVSNRLTLVIAVNGIVQTTTYTLPPHRGRVRFAAMVPEKCFRPGSNQIEILIAPESEAGSYLRASIN